MDTLKTKNITKQSKIRTTGEKLPTEHKVWVEKYRPEKLSEIIGQEEITERLQKFVENDSVPHLLFAGPPGNGKTTSALAVARELFGEGWRQNFLELNASDERGIDTIRNRVKDYARTRPVGEASYKIIYLDEADALTSEAQHALRRTMEMYSDTCRFILACNYSSKIIEPIQSRCAVFRFKRLSEEDVKKVLESIGKKENLELKEDGVEAIIYVSEGDMRQAINILQAASALEEEINENIVYQVSATASPGEVREMIKLAFNGDFEEARDKLMKLIINQGLAGDDILQQIHREIYNLDIPDPMKVKLVDKIGEYDFRIVEGANERIQLEAALAHFSRLGNRLKS